MRIGYLGAGSWGFALSLLLASKGYQVFLWTKDREFAEELERTRVHPKLPGHPAPENIVVTSNMQEALTNVDMIVESVTSQGIRPVFETVRTLVDVSVPIVITSKGIEQNSGMLLPEVVLDIFGDSARSLIGCLSGPSHAEEIVKHLPTSVVAGAYVPMIMHRIVEVFTTNFFRVYPNSDLNGVAFGGAMKNIIAIACGISDGLGFGDNTKAALMTRGLHEIRKLSAVKGCKPETLNGLSGLGDLCVTCLSTFSRNYNFGRLLATGMTPDAAKDSIGMAVEGMYTCVSAVQLGKKTGIPLPVSEAVHAIIYEGLNPREAVKGLLQRAIKEEHL